jgi:hypothetical protein
VTQSVLREVGTEILFTISVSLSLQRVKLLPISAVLYYSFCCYTCNLVHICLSAMTFRLCIHGPWAVSIHRCINSMCVDSKRRSFLKDILSTYSCIVAELLN